MTSQTTNQTQTTNRLNLWDFDDTLAFSAEAVEVLKASRPDVEGWRWWHVPELSISAVMVTDAIEGMWAELVATPCSLTTLSPPVQPLTPEPTTTRSISRWLSREPPC